MSGGTWTVIGIIVGLVLYFVLHVALDCPEPWGSILAGVGTVAAIIFGISRESHLRR